MPIKNYTTTVEVYKSVGEIQGMLAQKKARKIMLDYSVDGHITAIAFAIDTPNGLQGIRLPANVDRVYQVLKNQKVKVNYDQAERVAWRILKDWTAAQLAILETEMVSVEQVFLPYFINENGQTVFEVYQNGQLRLEGSDQ